MTKKNVLILGMIGSILLFLPAILNQILSCYKENWFFCSDSYEVVVILMLSLVPIFLLSILTYRMPDNVFRAWWDFARWFVPVIIVVTFLLNNKGGGGGYLGMDTLFDGLIYFILYSTLVIVSLVKIVHARRKL